MVVFSTTYKIEKKRRNLFYGDWKTVVKNLSLKEAEAYLKEVSFDFLGESKRDYRIIKE